MRASLAAGALVRFLLVPRYELTTGAARTTLVPSLS